MNALTMKELVRKARSFRRFDEKDRIPESVLRELVDLARITPSGGNSQPLRYRIVSQKEECDAVFPHLQWAAFLKDWPGPAEGERPTGYIVLLAEGNPMDAVGIAGQTIQLAATDMGWGTIMLGSVDRDKVRAALKLADPWKIKIVVALGRPAETVLLEEVHEGDSLEYYRTADGVHHVPKLALEDVLVA